jgi:hypothetical protein
MCDNQVLFTNVGSSLILTSIFIDITNDVFNYLAFVGSMKRDIITVTDNSFDDVYGDYKPRANSTIVEAYPHITANSYCLSLNDIRLDNRWGGAAVCNQYVTIRKVMFTNLAVKNSFTAQYMKVLAIQDDAQLVTSSLLTAGNPPTPEYTSITSRQLQMEP